MPEQQAAGASVASECFFPGQIPDHIPFNLLQSVLLLIIGYHFLNSLISETVFWFIRKLESFMLPLLSFQTANHIRDNVLDLLTHFVLFTLFTGQFTSRFLCLLFNLLALQFFCRF
jgi:hypothetical protein